MIRYLSTALSPPVQTDVGAAREAYDAFLAQYPYCYGYWRKYADYEKTKGDKGRCEEVSAVRRMDGGPAHPQ